MQCSRLIRPVHPAIVPPVPWESADPSAAEGAISPENAQVKGPQNENMVSHVLKLWRAASTAPTDGANLSGIEDRGVKRKMCIFRFTPFPFLELALINVRKGLIC